MLPNMPLERAAARIRSLAAAHRQRWASQDTMYRVEQGEAEVRDGAETAMRLADVRTGRYSGPARRPPQHGAPRPLTVLSGSA